MLEGRFEPAELLDKVFSPASHPVADDRVDVDPLRDSPIEYPRYFIDMDAYGIDQMGQQDLIAPKFMGHRQ